jgi:hypothetical protein
VAPPTYFDVLAPAGGSTKPVDDADAGGAHTGACSLATANSRPGWAQAFLRAVHMVVPDCRAARNKMRRLAILAAIGFISVSSERCSVTVNDV